MAYGTAICLAQVCTVIKDANSVIVEKSVYTRQIHYAECLPTYNANKKTKLAYNNSLDNHRIIGMQFSC